MQLTLHMVLPSWQLQCINFSSICLQQVCACNELLGTLHKIRTQKQAPTAAPKDKLWTILLSMPLTAWQADPPAHHNWVAPQTVHIPCKSSLQPTHTNPKLTGPQKWYNCHAGYT
jgi:hypothetical protein